VRGVDRLERATSTLGEEAGMEKEEKEQKKDPWQLLREAARRKAAELETELGAGIERAGEVVRGVASTARSEVSRVEEEYRVTEQIREVVAEVGG
jgi:hypothetical protein